MDTGAGLMGRCPIPLSRHLDGFIPCLFFSYIVKVRSPSVGFKGRRATHRVASFVSEIVFGPCLWFHALPIPDSPRRSCYPLTLSPTCVRSTRSTHPRHPHPHSEFNKGMGKSAF